MSEQDKKYRYGVCDCANCLRSERFEGVIRNLNRMLTTAETAAIEYAKQAAELQEEVERLREGIKFFLSVRHEYHRTRRGVEVYDDAIRMLESLAKTETE